MGVDPCLGPGLLWTGWPPFPFGYGLDWFGISSGLTQVAPYLIMPAIAAAWAPLTQAIVLLQRTPTVALVALNALNVGDALSTRLALHGEGAVESNPVARLIGLPGKLVIVGLLSVLLLRLRPRLLAWLVLPFLSVLVWHLAGFLASRR